MALPAGVVGAEHVGDEGGTEAVQRYPDTEDRVGYPVSAVLLGQPIKHGAQIVDLLGYALADEFAHADAGRIALVLVVLHASHRDMTPVR